MNRGKNIPVFVISCVARDLEQDRSPVPAVLRNAKQFTVSDVNSELEQAWSNLKILLPLMMTRMMMVMMMMIIIITIIVQR